MRILCLGDSQTFGFGVPRRLCWVTLSGKRLGCEMANRGLPGDTTGGMLARYGAEMERFKPAAIIVMGGSNDVTFGGGDASARANIGAIVHQSQARGVTPILCTPPPKDIATARRDWAALMDYGEAERIMDGYAEWLRVFAKVFGIGLVDFRQYLSETRESVHDGIYVDGIHPNERGHELMAEFFCERVRPLLGL